jgi:hypothetical protein
MAIGSIVTKTSSRHGGRPRLRFCFVASAVFGVELCRGCHHAELLGLPSHFRGGRSRRQTMMTTANGAIDAALDASADAQRRVTAYAAIFAGRYPIGAPIVGWVANEFGPRWALGVGAASGIVATIVRPALPVRATTTAITAGGSWACITCGSAVVPADRVAAEIVTAEVLYELTDRTSVRDCSLLSGVQFSRVDLPPSRTAPTGGRHTDTAQWGHVVVVAAAADGHVTVPDVDLVGGGVRSRHSPPQNHSTHASTHRDCLTDRRVGLRGCREVQTHTGPGCRPRATLRARVRDVLADSLAVGPGLGGGQWRTPVTPCMYSTLPPILDRWRGGPAGSPCRRRLASRGRPLQPAARCAWSACAAPRTRWRVPRPRRGLPR